MHRYVGLQPCWPSCRGVKPLRRVRTGAIRLRHSARPLPTATLLLRVGTVHRLHLCCRRDPLQLPWFGFKQHVGNASSQSPR